MQMDSICVHGGVTLQGKVRIQGSKNAALPILAATLLTRGENIIYNCPKISDIYQMEQLLKSIGCLVKTRSDCVCIDTGCVQLQRMPAEAVQGMRSSICMLGTLLSRCGQVTMEYPGGCVIGARPIDMHLAALQRMGAEFEIEDGLIHGQVKGRLHGADICFSQVSVGATENTILAAVLADGVTCIKGAAREPEVTALCEYLIGCGARINGVGSSCLEIVGVESLEASSFRIPADRIVAGTYLLGTVAAGGNVWLEEAPCEQMQAVLDVAEQMGAVYQRTKQGLYVQAPEKVKQIHKICTDTYPGFPTDLQSVALVTALKAEGSCIIEENIFENRFHVAEPLCTMGADLKILDSRRILVRETPRLTGKEVEAKELRGGAALVIAGLIAEGITTVRGGKYIMRGYENICKDLRELGARIVGV